MLSDVQGTSDKMCAFSTKPEALQVISGELSISRTNFSIRSSEHVFDHHEPSNKPFQGPYNSPKKTSFFCSGMFFEGFVELLEVVFRDFWRGFWDLFGRLLEGF